MAEYKLDLPESDLQIVLGILNEHIPDRPVYVFGSRVKGKARRRSDLDLAIGGAGELTLHQRATLATDFSESDLPIEVDVVDMTAVSDEFRHRIEKDWILLRPAVENGVAA